MSRLGFISFCILNAALISCVAAAADNNFQVYGRMRVQGDSVKAECEICIDCEGWSGGSLRVIKCEPMQYMNGAKVLLDVRTEMRKKKCEFTVIKTIKILSPEEDLPEYLDKKELKSLLDCKKG